MKNIFNVKKIAEVLTVIVLLTSILSVNRLVYAETPDYIAEFLAQESISDDRPGNVNYYNGDSAPTNEVVTFETRDYIAEFLAQQSISIGKPSYIPEPSAANPVIISLTAGEPIYYNDSVGYIFTAKTNADVYKINFYIDGVYYGPKTVYTTSDGCRLFTASEMTFRGNAVITARPCGADGLETDASMTFYVVVDKRELLIRVAVNELGYKSGANDDTKYGKWYGLNNNPWCAMFVSWCANQAGISTDIIPKHASCGVSANFFKTNDCWKNGDSDYIPRRGDLIYFTDSQYVYKHIAIVTGYWNGKVYYIDGNGGNKTVTERTVTLKSSTIRGYGIPNY